jgi:hypothetical protein
MKRADLPVGDRKPEPGPLNPAGNKAYPFSDRARNWTKVQLPIRMDFAATFCTHPHFVAYAGKIRKG